MLLAVGTYSERSGGHIQGDLGEGIHTFRSDAEGRLSPTGQPPLKLRNPSYLCKHPTHPVIYAALENMNSDDGQEDVSEVAAVAVDLSTGALKELNRLKVPAPISCHLTCDGKRLYVANYMPNSKKEAFVFMLALRDEDGGLAKVLDAARFSVDPSGARGDAARGGFDAGRQETSHPHAAMFCQPGGIPTVITPDLGADVIHRLKVNVSADGGEAKFEALPLAKVPIGSGPRHAVVDEARGLIYAVCELTSKVQVVNMETMTVVQEVSTVPDDVNPYSINTSCAAIKFSHDGKTIYASNRGHDTIVSIKLDDAGRLGERSWCRIGGKCPRDFFVDPAGRFVLAFGQCSATISRLVVTADGGLRPTDDSCSVGSPVTCVQLSAL